LKGDVDVVFRVVTRGSTSLSSSAGVKSPGTEVGAKDTDTRMTYDRFIDALFQLAAKCYPESETPADAFSRVRIHPHLAAHC